MRGCVFQKRIFRNVSSLCSQTQIQRSFLFTISMRCYTRMPAVKNTFGRCLMQQSCLPYAQSLTLCQTRLFSGDGTFDDDETLSDDENSSEEDDNLDDHMVLDEGEYASLVQDAFGIPHRGHKVYVVQPVDRLKTDLPTTGELQLEESIALVKSIPHWRVRGSQIIGIYSQRKKFLLGTTQIQKLKEELKGFPDVTAVFFSVDILNYEQVKEIQTFLGITVWDRYSVVVQIFREHAKTQEAKLQVAVAEVFFLRKRLNEVHEGRETIGAEFVGGTGKTFIQARRILLRRRQRKLRAKLDELRLQRDRQRERRIKRQVPTVAVIGYTNCGKTTLIKSLTGDSGMVPQDQLFATLDVTVHAGYLPNNMKALFVDTVGFISNIPNALLNAFSATLEDALMADLVIHVEDTSNPDRELQSQNVAKTVKSMLNQEQLETMLHVGNKVDKINISDLERDEACMYVSAEKGIGLDVLREEIQTRLLKNTGHLQKRIRIPQNGNHLSYLHKEATIVSMEDDSDQENLIVNIVITAANYEKFKHNFGKRSKKTRIVYQNTERGT